MRSEELKHVILCFNGVEPDFHIRLECPLVVQIDLLDNCLLLTYWFLVELQKVYHVVDL